MAVSWRVEDHFEKKEVIKVLDEIRRPFEVAVWGSGNAFNYGAIIRLAHNFLASKLWGIDLQQDPKNPVSKPYYKRAAMTSHKWERKTIAIRTLEEFLSETSDRNIVAFERREELESQDLRSFLYPENPILFFGSEREGVPSSVLDRANHVVTIPCDGFVLDCNIATAAAIGMYDFVSKHTAPGLYNANALTNKTGKKRH